jgi:hypothetical protein
MTSRRLIVYFCIYILLIQQKVNHKIRIIPTNKEERSTILQEFIDQDKIPTWLGGEDTFIFDSNHYYDWNELARDAETLEYLVSMPNL